MRHLAVIIVGFSIAFNTTVPRHLDTMIDADVMGQAMRCQSVLLYYSFFSVLPLKIMDTMLGGAAGLADHPAVPAPDGSSGRHADSSSDDISLPGKSLIVKSVLLQPMQAGGGASIMMAGAIALHGTFTVVGRVCPHGWIVAMRQWMVMLPRGSIDAYIVNNLSRMREPIERSSQLAFSLRGV